MAPIKNASSRLWDRVSFHLHWLIALTVIFQVALILFREAVGHHGPYSIYRESAIQMHIYLGLFIFILACLFLLRKFLAQNNPNTHWTQLFPITRAARNLVLEDFKYLLKFKIPVRNTGGGLAGLVQGLGLLLVFGLAGLGTLAFIAWTFPILGLANQSHSIIEIHKFFGGLIWWYLGGHVGMACLHRILPDKYQIVLN